MTFPSFAVKKVHKIMPDGNVFWMISGDFVILEYNLIKY